jgi:hypothetical protein
LSKVRYPLLIFQFELVWIIWENMKPRGPRSSATRSEQWHRRADRVQTVAAALSAHGFAAISAAIPAHRFRRPQPPTHAAKRGAPPKTFPFSSPSAPASPLLSMLFAFTTAAPDADEKPSLLSPSHRPPCRSCASFLLERNRPQDTAPRVAEEMAVVQSPVHRAPLRGLAAPTVPRGRLRRHDLRPNSPPLHDL